MSEKNDATQKLTSPTTSRRTVLKLSAGAAVTTGLYATTGIAPVLATSRKNTDGMSMSHQAFVYTELQASVPFNKAPWAALNKVLLKQPGLVSKTWLAGVGNNSLGGLYTFDTIANAQDFVNGYFPAEAAKFGVAHTTRIFDAQAVKTASLDLDSPHFGKGAPKKPGAFVYTEVQVSIAFDKVPWQERNPALRKQTGLLSKTWLSGLNTQSVGGFDAFDTLENAKAFAIKDFPKVARKMKAAFYTRVFDARVTETASKGMRSPFYSG